MDPTANLDEQRELIASIQVDIDKGDPPNPEEVRRLCELTRALDEWLGKGGFAPVQWSIDEPSK